MGVGEVSEVEEVVLVRKLEACVAFGAAVELDLELVEAVISDKFGFADVSVLSSSSSVSSLDEDDDELVVSASWSTVTEGRREVEVAGLSNWAVTNPKQKMNSTMASKSECGRAILTVFYGSQPK